MDNKHIKWYGQRVTIMRFHTVFIEITLCQTTNFRLFQIERFADDNLEFDGNGRKLFKQVENTVGNGEIALNEQFLLFLQCFQKTCIADNQGLFGKGINMIFSGHINLQRK